MSVPKIVRYGELVLRKVSSPVEEITPELRKFIEEMFHALRRAHGLGLSAPQVGVNKRFFILDFSEVSLDHDSMVLINPKIISTSDQQTGEEGCLSFPGLFLRISRPNKAVCEYTNLDGKQETIEARKGLLARAILHENDHLDGKLFIDYLPPVDREMIAGKLKKIKVTT